MKTILNSRKLKWKIFCEEKSEQNGGNNLSGSQVGGETFDGEREKQVGFVLRCRLRSHRSVTIGETPQMTPNDEKVSKNFSLFSPRNLGRG